eukprot:Gb_41073 [translate_table: standard]
MENTVMEHGFVEHTSGCVGSYSVHRIGCGVWPVSPLPGFDVIVRLSGLFLVSRFLHVQLPSDICMEFYNIYLYGVVLYASSQLQADMESKENPGELEMETLDNHGFCSTNTFRTTSAMPVLNVQPLRSVSPFLTPPQPSHVTANYFPSAYGATLQPSYLTPKYFPLAYASPYTQCTTRLPSKYPIFDPAEVRRKLEQDIALRVKQEPKSSAVRNFPQKYQVASDTNRAGNARNQVGRDSNQVARNKIQGQSGNFHGGSEKNQAGNSQNDVTLTDGPPSILRQTPMKGNHPISCSLCDDDQDLAENQAGSEKYPMGTGPNQLDSGNFQVVSSQTNCPLHTYLSRQIPMKINGKTTVCREENQVDSKKFDVGSSSQNNCPLYNSISMQATAKSEVNTTPVVSTTLELNNQPVRPKVECSNQEGTSESKMHGRNVIGSTVLDLNTQDISAKELRSALARSLKRFKDLVVLEPGSTPQTRCNTPQAHVSSSGEMETISRKRKRTSRGTMIFHANEDNTSPSNDREQVRKALMTYDACRRNLSKEDESSKGTNGGSKRADLKAGTWMMDRGLWINRDRRIIGSVPGVHVGDQFYFRMELCVIGLHGPIQAGIDYISAKNSKWNEPVAISIIASGGYEDNEDGGEVLIYTGQGGNNYKLDKKQAVDQKLERGNLALERSMHYGVDIRVIRGIKDSGSPSGKIYIYDGIYKVQDSWLDKGRLGFGVFKYKLQRTPGQPELGSSILKSTSKWKSQPLTRVGLLHPDISSRREKVPVYLVNNFDNDKGPAHFEYITRPRYSNSVGNLEPCQGCDCIGGCAGEKCSCILRNGAEVSYNQNGILIKKKPLIYECGDKCRCPPSCRNRTTQKGLKNHIEVFKTSDRGWGVRCWDSIAAGTFICEYTGEVVSEGEAALQHEGNEYILSANHSQERWTDWGSIADILCEQKQQDVSSQASSSFSFFVDASKMGNVSRFMNHSCSPNVFMQFVLHDHHDTRFPHIVFFAMENIPPLTELTFDYGTNVPRVGDIEGSGGYKGAAKSKVCLCGASNCKGNFVW